MTRLTKFHRDTLEMVHLALVALPGRLLSALCCCLMVLYITFICMPTWFIFGYNTHEEIKDLLRTDI